MDPVSPSTEASQSFVIRMWQESPSKWRGTVRHVQSEAHRGFQTLSQALAFIEQRTSVPPSEHIQKIIVPTQSNRFDLSWLGARRWQPVWAVGALAVLLVVTLLLANPTANIPLAGAAVGRGGEFQSLAVFVCGAVLGGIAVALWFQHRNQAHD